MSEHDTLTRRGVLKGAAALPLAAILASPSLARAAADSLETVRLTTAGGKSVTAALALPDATPAPAVLLVHEWWGLNDQIKSVAGAFAGEGYVALAIDLYDGRIADSRSAARGLMGQVDSDEAFDTVASWVRWLKAQTTVSGRVGTVGWCFGGGWSLNASIAEPVDATVVYYGRVNQPSDQLAKLRGPVLGHFATRDGWIDRDMVGGFEDRMKALGQTLTSHWYEADHAFANPTSARYDAGDAALAWRRTLDFFKTHLGV